MYLHYCMNCFTPLQGDEACPNCGFRRENYTASSHYLPLETILHGRYLVGKVLGEGGFGITYLGFDLSLERKVAIKEYFPNGTVWRDSENGLTVSCYTTKNVTEVFSNGKQNCMKEARSLAKLDDIDSVVRVLDHFLENNTAYVIMEYIEGVTLKDYVMRLPSKLTFPQVFELLMPVMRALSAMHDRGFIHRDISPDNIMITPDGKAKLLDFGAVKSMAVPGAGASTENPTIKRGFSALEQYSTEGRLGAWTDVYAMCSTIFYLLTGTLVPEPMERIGAGSDVVAERLRSAAPESVSKTLLRGLAVKPQDRLQSMSELTSQLEGALPKPKPQSFWKRNLKWILPVAALFVIVTAVVSFFVIRNNSPVAENYTYGRDLRNLLADGLYGVTGNSTYFSDYYDSKNAGLYSVDNDGNFKVVLDETVKGINIIGNTLYYYNVDTNSIDCYSEGSDAPVQLYQGGRIAQLIAVDTAKTVYLYFSEVSGNQVYIQRFDVNTKEKISLSAGYNSMLYTIYQNQIYYVTDKHEVRTVGLVNGKDKSFINNTDVYSLCFVNDALYLQTEDSVLEATVNGKVIGTLPGIDPLYDFDDSNVCPLYGSENKLYYVDKTSRCSYQYDLNEKSGGEPLLDTVCYDFEFFGDSLLYTTKETDTPTLYMIDNISSDDSAPFSINPWSHIEAEEFDYGIDYYGNNANGSFMTYDNERLFYIYNSGISWKHREGDPSNFTYNKKASYSCMNFADEVFYMVATVNGVPNITKNNETIYSGTDVHNLQYYRRDNYEKLLFTDQDANGDYYAYSINLDGSALTRISHIPCAPESLDIYNNFILYSDADLKHLYLALATGQQVTKDPEFYSVPNSSDRTICQANFQGDGNVYISLNKAKPGNLDSVFTSVDPLSQEVLTENYANVSRFMLCYDGLYMINPIDQYIYYDSDIDDAYYADAKPVAKFKAKDLNRFDYNDKSYLAFHDTDDEVYIIEPDTHKVFKAVDYVLFE